MSIAPIPWAERRAATAESGRPRAIRDCGATSRAVGIVLARAAARAHQECWPGTATRGSGSRVRRRARRRFFAVDVRRIGKPITSSETCVGEGARGHPLEGGPKAKGTSADLATCTPSRRRYINLKWFETINRGRESRHERTSTAAHSEMPAARWAFLIRAAPRRRNQRRAFQRELGAATPKKAAARWRTSSASLEGSTNPSGR